MILSEEEIQANRVKAVEALTEADESKRAVGMSVAIRTQPDGLMKWDGTACACAIIWHDGLGRDLVKFGGEGRSDVSLFSYMDLADLLGIGNLDYIVSLNDVTVGTRSKKPKYKLKEIAQKLKKEWDI